MHDGYRYVRNRLVLATLLLLVSGGLAWWYFPQGAPVQRMLMATVVDVNSGSAKSFRTGENVTLQTVTVRLEDGREVVLPVFGRSPQRGERVTLLEARYPEGEVRYTLRPADQSF
jgi:hypothetical protein